MVAASKEWEQFALRLVSSSIASPDDFESLSGKEDFLLAFADVIQQTCFLGDFQAYLKEYGCFKAGLCTQVTSTKDTTRL